MRKRQLKKKNSNRIEKQIERGICILLFLLSMLAAVKTVFVSLDMDENYALAVGYRLAMGERLFLDLWESHQLGGVFLAPFLWLYLKLAGTADYIVIYARVAGTLIHILIGIFLYQTAVKAGELKKSFSLFLFFLHLNFLPKWVQCPEFELQQYWSILLLFLCLYRYYAADCQKAGYLPLGGALLTAQMFSYPTLLLLYPVYLAGIFFGAGDGEIKEKIKRAALFTAGALMTGGAFLAYLRSYLTLGQFLENIGYIFRDASHTMVQAAVKWQIFGIDFLKLLLPMSLFLGASIAIGVFIAKIRSRSSSAFKDIWREGVFLAVPIAMLLMGLAQFYLFLFADAGQFAMAWRFFVIALLGVLLYFAGKTPEIGLCFWFGVLPSFMTLVSVLIMTNMDVNTSMAKMYIGVLATAWMAGRYYEGEKKEGRMPVSARGTVKEWHIRRERKLERWLFKVGMVVFVGGLLFSKLILIRVSGCFPVTMLAPMRRIENGAAKGVYMQKDAAVVLEEDFLLLAEQLLANDKLLYIGGENIVYLWTKAQVATPSTQGTNAYNEMFIKYYEKYPKKMPTVIAVDKELGENPAYYVFPQNHVIYAWMEQMGYQEIADAPYMKLYRR